MLTTASSAPCNAATRSMRWRTSIRSIARSAVPTSILEIRADPGPSAGTWLPCRPARPAHQRPEVVAVRDADRLLRAKPRRRQAAIGAMATSAAKRVSRWMRASSASAIALNASTRRPRSGSIFSSRRVSSAPCDALSCVGHGSQRANEACQCSASDRRSSDRGAGHTKAKRPGQQVEGPLEPDSE